MYSQKHTERFVRDPMNPTGGETIKIINHYQYTLLLVSYKISTYRGTPASCKPRKINALKSQNPPSPLKSRPGITSSTSNRTVTQRTHSLEARTNPTGPDSLKSRP